MSYLCGFVVVTTAWAAAEMAAGVLAWLIAEATKKGDNNG